MTIAQLHAEFIDHRARADERVRALNAKVDALGESLDAKIHHLDEHVTAIARRLDNWPRGGGANGWSRPVLYGGGSAAGVLALLEGLKYIAHLFGLGG